MTRSAMTAAEMAERIRSRYYDTPAHARRALQRQRSFTAQERRELGVLIERWVSELGVFA